MKATATAKFTPTIKQALKMLVCAIFRTQMNRTVDAADIGCKPTEKPTIVGKEE